MADLTQQFIASIKAKTKVRLTFYSKQDESQQVRLCAPMDFGASSRAKNKDDRYHLWDYESERENHTLSLLPNQVVSMEFTDLGFNPAEFVTWKTNWIVKRDWGMYS